MPSKTMSDITHRDGRWYSTFHMAWLDPAGSAYLIYRRDRDEGDLHVAVAFGQDDLKRTLRRLDADAQPGLFD